MKNSICGDGVFKIGNRYIGHGYPTYVIAEMSANHGGDFQRAVDIVHAAKDAGADAIKLQTYTADTLTLDCQTPPFFINSGPWGGQTMHQLYQSASTPWEWQPRLKEVADKIGITLFSAPFDSSAVDFLEEIGVPAYKIASYEIIELELIKKVAETSKPVIISTGQATLGEIDEAVQVAILSGAQGVALLKCTSVYPAPYSEMNLRTIPHLIETFGLPVGISDHSLGIGAAIASVSMGASIVEKHFTLDENLETPDSFFSMTPVTFKRMVQEIRCVEEALGQIVYKQTPDESRRGLFAVKDIKVGEFFNRENVRSVRPGGGLSPRFLSIVEGRRATCNIKRGNPILWELVGS